MGNIMHCHSPLGDITVVSDQTGDALIGLWFDGQRGFDNALSERVSPRPFPILREAERWLDIYFSGRSRSLCPGYHRSAPHSVLPSGAFCSTFPGDRS